MRRHRPHIFRATSSLPVAAAAIVAAGAIAACGSNSPSSSGVSSSGGQPTQAELAQHAVRFASCMRSHRDPSFPDPTTSPHQIKVALGPNSGIARSPAFQRAYTACQHLLLGGGPVQNEARSQAQIAAFVAFARCMRSHGFPSFPDPTSSGRLTDQMLANAGINPHQPAVLQTAGACVSVTHGVLTRADVASFVAGQ